MMKLGLLSLLILMSCQTYNSNSDDAAKYRVTTINGSSEFQAAFTIIKNRCASCHTNNYHAEWATLTSEEQWKDRGLVIAGDPNNSILVNKIKNFGAGYSNMPVDSGNLPDAEYTAIVNWVTNLE